MLGEPERRCVFLLERVPLVAEDRRGEQVQEAVLVVAAHRMVEAGRRLEREPASPARPDELRQSAGPRDALAPAANLRAQPERGELVEADGVSRLDLDVDLCRRVHEDVRVKRGRRLDCLDPIVGRRKRARVEHDRERQRLACDFRELRRGDDEPFDEPAVRAAAEAPVLGQRLVGRQARGREQRRVVDQAPEEGATGVGRRLGPRHLASVQTCAPDADKNGMDATQFPWHPLGKLLVDRGVLNETQLELALAEQQRTGRLLGQILVGAGYLTAVSLALALADQHGVELRRRRKTDWLESEAEAPSPQASPPQQWRPLGALLVESGFVTKEQLDEALTEQRHDPGRRLGEILVVGGALSGPDLARALAEQHGVSIAPDELDAETVLRPSTPGEPVYQIWDVGLKPAYELQAVVHEAANFLDAVDFAAEYVQDRDPHALEITVVDGRRKETVWTYSKMRADAKAAQQEDLTGRYGFDPLRWGREHAG